MIDFIALSQRIARGEIPALSIKQPWPHDIFYNGKNVENRSWPTKRRDWFIVQAGISKSDLAIGQHHLPRGGIVGMARITDCVQVMESRWFFGKYGFVLADAFPVDLIPCKGALGFFRPDDAALQALALAVAGKAVSHD